MSDIMGEWPAAVERPPPVLVIPGLTGR
jgi:hypothetical protein